MAPGVAAAAAELEKTFGPLGALDPKTHVGLVLIDSTHGVEEETKVERGNHAPLISFVGGSAGDDLAFKETRVVTSAGSTRHGAALMLLELARPFRVSKACHFAPTEMSCDPDPPNGSSTRSPGLVWTRIGRR